MKGLRQFVRLRLRGGLLAVFLAYSIQAMMTNPGSPVSQLYRPPFAFAGTVFKVTADISGQSHQDAAAERNAAAKAAMSQQ
jgi:hypothetical protein